MSENPTTTGVGHPELLGIYCNDHLAASEGGIELVRRMLDEHRGSAHEDDLRQLLRELREEKSALTGVTRVLGLPVRRYKQAALWLAEKASRGKLNGHLLSRSPLSSLIEFEALTSAVRAKRSGFETLRMAAEVDGRIDKELLDGLIEQANRQYHWLTEARRQVAVDLFGGDPAVLAGIEET